MNVQEQADKLNAMIAARDVAGRKLHEIRANDPMWTRPLACVKVEGEYIPESIRPEQRVLVAVDVYGFSRVAYKFFDGRVEVYL